MGNRLTKEHLRRNGYVFESNRSDKYTPVGNSHNRYKFPPVLY